MWADSHHFQKPKMLRTGAVRAFATAAPRPATGKRAHKKGVSRFAKAGLPFVLFVVGGFVGLTQVRGEKLAIPLRSFDCNN